MVVVQAFMYRTSTVFRGGFILLHVIAGTYTINLFPRDSVPSGIAGFSYNSYFARILLFLLVLDSFVNIFRIDNHRIQLRRLTNR